MGTITAAWMGGYFAAVLHDPVSAADWSGYVSRFVEAPFTPLDGHMTAHTFDTPFMWLPLCGRGLEHHWQVTWLDVWVYFCLTRGIGPDQAWCGPWQDLDLQEAFEERRGQFLL
jgi:hypothetical protein